MYLFVCLFVYWFVCCLPVCCDVANYKKITHLRETGGHGNGDSTPDNIRTRTDLQRENTRTGGA